MHVYNVVSFEMNKYTILSICLQYTNSNLICLIIYTIKLRYDLLQIIYK